MASRPDNRLGDTAAEQQHCERFNGLLNRLKRARVAGDDRADADEGGRANQLQHGGRSPPLTDGTDSPLDSRPHTNQRPGTAEPVDDGATVLVNDADPSLTDGTVCRVPCWTATVPDTNVLLVSINIDANERYRRYSAHRADPPANLALVTAGESVRSQPTGTGRSPDAALTLDSVPDPGDLTDLGITISGILDEWHGNGHQTVICFHSLSTLLQYAELQRVFRFIRLLKDKNQVDDIGARTHYHIDSTAHAPQTYATLRPLFDTVIEASENAVPAA